MNTYMVGARTDDERFIYVDPPKVYERLEEVMPTVLRLRTDVGDQIRRQSSIGLAENLANLSQAEAAFNAVFTTSFCFKVRDDVRGGATTLQKLNRELKTIQFGYDTYELEWEWYPKYQRYFQFFEALHEMADTLEKDKCSIFDSPRLTEDHRETAHEIMRFLLSNDQIQSEKQLKELAGLSQLPPLRHHSTQRPPGETKLSTWGTGSGGELETPFYVIRSAVLAHCTGSLRPGPSWRAGAAHDAV